MPLIGFTVFKEKILNGSKTQTIRELRKHSIKQNDILYLYWHLRQKDCQYLLTTTCTETFIIQMHSEYWFNKQHALLFRWKETIPWERISPKETLDIAKRDGFIDDVDMVTWFQKRGLPRVFQIIRW